MPKYVMEGEAIEGKRIFCTFEIRPCFGEEKETQRKTVSITGNPAVAVLKRTWKYKKQE